MKKKLLSVGIAVCILLGFAVVPTSAEVSAWDGSVAAGFESGSGTEEDPYIIKTAPQLAYLAQSVNSGITYKGQYILLVNDIVLNTSDMFATDENGNITGAASGKTPTEWTAIGYWNSDKRPFCGAFDGNNHKIEGIYINKPNSDDQGFFGYCLESVIKNLNIASGYVCGNNKTAGIVSWNHAYTADALVENCSNAATIIGNGKLIGGIVGSSLAYSTNAAAVVKNCYNSGMVVGKGEDTGGIVGHNSADSGIADVKQCYNLGIISGRDNVGGVVGNNYAGSGTATVSNCYNTGSVTNDVEDYYIAGVVGSNYVFYNNSNGTVIVENSYNVGTVNGNVKYNGGAVAYNIAYNGSKAKINNCYYLDSCITLSLNGYGSRLTENEMKQQASFAGFDFDTVWTMGGNPDYPYPELIGMYYGGSSPIIDEPTIIESGTCGDNLTWALDDEGTLTISGTGNMKNYSWNNSPFLENSSIKKVIIENGVTSIGDQAFRMCYGLASIEIPDSITSIGSLTFYKCESLTYITIGNKVTSIDSYAFDDCASLTEINVLDNNPNYSSQDGVLFNKNKTTLIQYPNGKGGAYTVPYGVTKIDTSAFENCGLLTSVEIPKSVVDIGSWSFRRCTSLTEINVSEDNSYFSSQDGVLFDKNKNTLIQCPAGYKNAHYIVPNGVTSIGRYALLMCENLTSVKIPDSVISIGEEAFCGCNNLADIEIGNGVETIDIYAFWACESLTSVKIPDSVKTIGSKAFSDCTGLTSVTIGSGVNRIGNSAFENCDSITDVYYDGSEEDWSKVTIIAGNKALLNATMHFAVEPIENKGIIKIGTAKGKAGRTVDVTVSLENNPGITSMLLNIDYDNSALTLTNVADSGILGSTCHSDNFANAPYSLYWNNGTATENFTANGVIATLTFEIDEGAYVGDYPITVWYNSDDILDFDLDEVYFDTENGNVSVISFIYGDVNGDEKITLKDDAFLARYLAHWIGYDETNVDLDSADVNADGKVGVRDNAILARFIARWTGYEELPYVR